MRRNSVPKKGEPMPSLIDDLTEISIQSPYFSPASDMELFPVHSKAVKGFKNRVAILYGSNGSGKSTIARAFNNYANASMPSDVTLVLKDKNHNPLSPSGRPRIFVFDETYVEQNIKVQSGGLDAIVLFGKQGELEEKIAENAKNMSELQKQIDSQEKALEPCSDPSKEDSPNYWINAIRGQLKRRWADIQGITINGHRQAAAVNEREIDRIGNISSSDKTEDELKAEYNRMLNIYNSMQSNAQPINNEIKTISLPQDLQSRATELLRTIPKRPELTERETELLKLFDYAVIRDARDFLFVSPQLICCPKCLQLISSQYRRTAIESIEKILNREMEEFNEKLKSLLLSPIELNLPDDMKENCSIALQYVDEAITRHNAAVQEKMNAPFSAMEYNAFDNLYQATVEMNKILSQLECERQERNAFIKNRTAIRNSLSALNDQMAHNEIESLYRSLTGRKKEKAEKERFLEQLKSKMATLQQETERLDAQRRNFVLATEEINRALEYIFFSKDRMRVELGSNQRYALKIRNQSVEPDQVSCGERNALALSYFFTDIANNAPSDKLYSEEMLLVIDDPVSSLDVGNRVGILSFLRMRLQKVLRSNPNTKILFMTHDLSVLYDIGKGMEEISKWCAGNSKHAEFSYFQLSDCSIKEFEYKGHNEYTDMMQFIYQYAQNPHPENDLTIGNVMRRTLEAFSTFLFRQTIDAITLDDEVLQMLSNDTIREYFKNSMYRLVLNGESHTAESARGVPEAAFWSHLSPTEKQRTARDILCFMYAINPHHVLKHLSAKKNGMKDEKQALENWMANISGS